MRVLAVRIRRVWGVFPVVVFSAEKEGRVHGYLAHKKPHLPLGPSQGPTHVPTVGSWSRGLWFPKSEAPLYEKGSFDSALLSTQPDLSGGLLCVN